MTTFPYRFGIKSILFPYATLSSLAVALALPASSLAQTTVTTGPVGVFKAGAYDAQGNYLGLLGGSDTFVSIPLTRPPEYVGTMQSGSNNVITISGTPNLTSNQFVYAAGTQPKTYYVQLGANSSVTNPKEGSSYLVTANSANTLTLNLNGDDISNVPTGTQISVIPYWTLKTVFPNSDAGVSFTTSPSTKNRSTQILFPDFTGTGINLAPKVIYFHFNGAWRLAGADSTVDHGDDVLLTNSYFIIRNLNSPTTALTVTGNVLTGKSMVSLATQTSVQQDNSVALVRPVDVTLNNLGLISSGAFVASPSTKNRADQLLVFDNTVVGINKSAPLIYYYFNGAWRKAGAPDSSVDYGTDVIPAGSGFVIRKATTAGGATAFWQGTPTY